MVCRGLSIFGFSYRTRPVNGIVLEGFGHESALFQGDDLADGMASVDDREPLTFPSTTKNLA